MGKLRAYVYEWLLKCYVSVCYCADDAVQMPCHNAVALSKVTVLFRAGTKLAF